MGYITAVLTPEERRRAGPKNGAQATATISLDPLGSVSVQSPRAAGAGPSHRARAGRRRCAGPQTRATCACHRYRHRQGRLVDRLRQLLQPLRARGRRRRAARGGAAARQARPHRRAQLNVAAGRDRVRGRPRRAPRAIRTTRCPSPASPPPSHWAPGTLPGGRGSGAPRDRVLDAARADGADRGGRGEFLALPRLHLRLLRRRDRARHRGGAHRQIRDDARLRPGAASRHGRGAGDRRLRPCARRRDAGGVRLRRRTAASSPAPSPTTSCRPRWRCRSP